MSEEYDKQYGKEVIINGPVVANDGTTWEDYSLEEHLFYLIGIIPRHSNIFEEISGRRADE